MERKPSLAHRLIPSVGDLFFITVLCSLYFTAKSSLLSDGDTGYHIRAGELILATGAVPRFDSFSLHSPPIPWIAHEWLSEVLMAATHRMLGMSGIVAGSALLLALTGYLLFWSLRNSNAGVLLASAVTLLALASSQLHWLARPHLFSLLLLVIFHHLIESWHRERGNDLYLLPPSCSFGPTCTAGSWRGSSSSGPTSPGTWRPWRWPPIPSGGRCAGS
ncbi:hypothetical protein [Citrifermentans bemidjiense]|uniref:hypothetical protein n=1 Tax=Citrifermentans bemidjiense TaxID=225194 RepID=UPI00014F9D78|nr:hypothetical protein [Citrifermentans bemidjiense]